MKLKLPNAANCHILLLNCVTSVVGAFATDHNKGRRVVRKGYHGNCRYLPPNSQQALPGLGGSVRVGHKRCWCQRGMDEVPVCWGHQSLPFFFHGGIKMNYSLPLTLSIQVYLHLIKTELDAPSFDLMPLNPLL